MGEEGRKYPARDAGESARVQGGGAQGRAAARLRQALRLRGHLRRRLRARARLPLAHHPVPRPQPRGRPRPGPLEVWLVAFSFSKILFSLPPSLRHLWFAASSASTFNAGEDAAWAPILFPCHRRPFSFSPSIGRYMQFTGGISWLHPPTFEC